MVLHQRIDKAAALLDSSCGFWTTKDGLLKIIAIDSDDAPNLIALPKLDVRPSGRCQDIEINIANRSAPNSDRKRRSVENVMNRQSSPVL